MGGSQRKGKMIMCLAGLIAVLTVSGLGMGLQPDPLRSLAPPAHVGNGTRSYSLLMEGQVQQWDLGRLKRLRGSGKGPDVELKEETLGRHRTI